MLNSLWTSAIVGDVSVPHRLRILYAGYGAPLGNCARGPDHAALAGSAPTCPPAPEDIGHGTADLWGTEP